MSKTVETHLIPILYFDFLLKCLRAQRKRLRRHRLLVFFFFFSFSFSSLFLGGLAKVFYVISVVLVDMCD